MLPSGELIIQDPSASPTGQGGAGCSTPNSGRPSPHAAMRTRARACRRMPSLYDQRAKEATCTMIQCRDLSMTSIKACISKPTRLHCRDRQRGQAKTRVVADRKRDFRWPKARFEADARRGWSI